MRTFDGVDELAGAVGEHLGHSEWHTITQERVDTFADATGDHQWIHVDVDRAAAGPFGTTIAHGYLTTSLIPMLTQEVYRVENLAMGINYGSDKVRFPAPVPVGSRLRAGVELVGVDPMNGGHRITTRVTLECSSATKPACVADILSFVVGS